MRDGPLRKRQTDKIQSQTNTEEEKKNLYPLLRCSSAFNRRHHTWEQHSSISQSLVYLWVWVEKEKPQICVHIQCLSMTQVCVWVASAALDTSHRGGVFCGILYHCVLWYSEDFSQCRYFVASVSSSATEAASHPRSTCCTQSL